MKITTGALTTQQVGALLRSRSEGEILMVNSSGVYFTLAGQVLLLCDECWGTVPIGIGIADMAVTVRRLSIHPGQTLLCRENELTFPGGTLVLEPESSGECSRGGCPVPERCRRAQEELLALKKDQGVSMLAGALIDGSEAEIIRTNPYCERAYPLLRKLMAALSEQDTEQVERCAEGLLGLGPGLTPSLDDVLLGMIFVFDRAQADSGFDPSILHRGVCRMCDGCTNRISSAYLKAVSAGWHFARMEQVWLGLCGERELCCRRLTDIGSNSGAEMLMGMLLAVRVLEKKGALWRGKVK